MTHGLFGYLYPDAVQTAFQSTLNWSAWLMMRAMNFMFSSGTVSLDMTVLIEQRTTGIVYDR